MWFYVILCYTVYWTEDIEDLELNWSETGNCCGPSDICADVAAARQVWVCKQHRGPFRRGIAGQSMSAKTCSNEEYTHFFFRVPHWTLCSFAYSFAYFSQEDRCIFEACCLDVDWENMQVLGQLGFRRKCWTWEISQYNHPLITIFSIFTDISYIHKYIYICILDIHWYIDNLIFFNVLAGIDLGSLSCDDDAHALEDALIVSDGWKSQSSFQEFLFGTFKHDLNHITFPVVTGALYDIYLPISTIIYIYIYNIPYVYIYIL